MVLYGTGLGSVTAPIASGVPAPSAVLATNLTPTVTVGSQSAEVLFSGLTPGLVGIYQINIRVPPNASSGNQDVVASFPSYEVCCIGAGTAARTYTVHVDSKGVKLSVR